MSDHNQLQIDFIGIGGEKCGSTWVSELLAAHPDILFSGQKSKKELRFFNQPRHFKLIKDRVSSWSKGFDWYHQQFPAPQPGKIRGEFSVSYLGDSIAADRIKQHLPTIKLLVILRDPVGKLYSLYKQARLSVEIEPAASFARFCRSPELLAEAKYFKQLKPYFDLFPADQIHVMLLSDFKSNPKQALQQLYQFLEVDEQFVPPALTQKINPTRGTRFAWLQAGLQRVLNMVRSSGLEKIYQWLIKQHSLYALYRLINHQPAQFPPPSAETRGWVIAQLRADIEQLEQLIDRDLGSWLKI